MDMPVSNIQRFDEITGKVLAALYEAFPVPIYLPAAQFVEQPTRQCDHMGEVPSEEAEFFIACVKWLAEAGYLKLSGTNYGCASDVVLTAKGLETLKAVPKSLHDSPSIGEQLIEATKDGVLDQVRELANSFLKRGFALAATTTAEYLRNTQ